MWSYFILSATACALTLMLTPLARRFALGRGWVDWPDERKRHRIPVPRIGGVPIVAAYLGSFALLSLIDASTAAALQDAVPVLLWLLPATAVVFGVGLIDDLVGLSPIVKLAGQSIAAALACMGGIRISGIAYHPIEPYIGIPLTIVWLVGCTNAFNLIDGIDGLAAGLGLLATITTLAAALLHGDSGLVIAMAPLAGALLGFLRYNYSPASVFLGDSGSLSIGFMLGCCAVIWSQKCATILGMTAPLMALSVPLLDMLLAMVRRFLLLQPIFAGDRGHIHHRLLDRGFTPRRVVLLLYMTSGVAACFALLQATMKDAVLLLTIVFCIMALGAIAGLKYAEFVIVGRLLRENQFRGLIKFHNVLRIYEDTVKSAETAEECWDALRDLASHLGSREIALRLNGDRRRERFTHTSGRFWILTVPLEHSDYVELFCSTDWPGGPIDAGLLSSVLRETLSGKAVQIRDPDAGGPVPAASRPLIGSR